MSTRSEAIKWIESILQSRPTPLFSSKLFDAKESWTRRKTWWIQVPVSYLEGTSDIHIICKKNNNKTPFRYLKVPVAFFRYNLNGFTILNNRINLHLSAEYADMFKDHRGPGEIMFDKFLMGI